MLADDELDLRIHNILARLDGDTYSIPHGFRRAVVDRIGRTNRAGTLNRIRQRKRTLWPIITRELEAFGLPEELGDVAWLESQMDPSAQGALGALGLWQFLPESARAYGLRVDGVSDERTDPAVSRVALPRTTWPICSRSLAAMPR